MGEADILINALTDGIIDLDTIKNQMVMNERKKYLAEHDNKIWQGANGKYYTYLNKDNKRKQIRKNTIKEVEDEIINHYKSLEEKIYLEDVFEDWIARKLDYGEIQQQTVDRYRTDFTRFFKNNPINRQQIKYITEDDLEEFIKMTIKEKSLSAKGWSNLRTLLNGIFKRAKKLKYTEISISTFLKDLELSSKVFTKRIKEDNECVFDQQEIEMLKQYFREHDKSLSDLGVTIAIYTGMRVGEIVSLKWEDIKDDYIFIRRTQIVYKENGKCQTEVRDFPKTEAAIRKVIMVDEVKRTFKKARLLNPNSTFVFEYEGGQPFTKHALNYKLYKACESLGINRRSMHCLRKTFATHLINSGVDEAIIINQLGHTDIETTKKHYYFNDKTIDYIKSEIQNAMNY